MSEAHEKYIKLQRLRNVAPDRLDPAVTALVIVDMQNYFVDPDSPLSRMAESQVPGVLSWYHERSRDVVEPALRGLLASFRERGAPVVFTTVASEREDGRDLMPIFQGRNAAARERQLPHFIPHQNDEWAQIVPGLAPAADELIVNKTTYGTFTSTGLDRTLRHLGVTTIVIGGVVTNVCVETTARDAADLGYEVIMVSDGCAAYSAEIQEATMLSFMGPFGAVLDAKEVSALFDGGAE